MAITDWKRLDEKSVLLTFNGTLNEDEHAELARTLAQIAADCPVERLILDKTRLELGEDAELADTAAREAAEVMCDHDIRAVAFIARPGQKGIDPFRTCFERICGEVEVFESVQRATDWLDIDAGAARHLPRAG